jgi:hypothetical protein
MLSEQHWYKWFREDISHICLCGNVLDIYLTLNHYLPDPTNSQYRFPGSSGVPAPPPSSTSPLLAVGRNDLLIGDSTDLVLKVIGNST